MKAKAIAVLLTMTFLASITSTLSTVPCMAATEEEIEAAIGLGVVWLAGQQNPDGSWGDWDQVGKTGFAVLKLETHAIRECIDPLDMAYEYYDQVRKGLDYIFANAWTMTIGLQPAGDPDTDGDSIGVYFVSPADWHRTYETGIAMMAIAASTHPEMIVDVPGSNVDGWTYEEVLCDAVDYLAFGQNDAGNERGGWGYLENYGGWSDNSNTGYAVLGLAYAEAPTIDSKTGFGCTIPDFVRSELEIWIDYIQNDVDGDLNDGGSGYVNPEDWVNILKTGNLLFEMAFVGDTADTPRVMDAVDYIERHWNDADPDPGWRGWPGDVAHKQAMYTTMKGFEALHIDTIIVDSMEVDWFDEMSTVLVAQQNPDGSWGSDLWGDELLGTEWALLTLQKAVVIPAIPVYADIKPASWPNPLQLKGKGVLPVAICGTEDFDVTAIDPASIRLTIEGLEEGVAPLRWSYEDVATPYMGEPCSGHDLGPDGYLDLTLKFKAQEVIDTLGLDAYSDGDVVIIVVTGNLKEEHDGTPIQGQDCIIIRGR